MQIIVPIRVMAQPSDDLILVDLVTSRTHEFKRRKIIRVALHAVANHAVNRRSTITMVARSTHSTRLTARLSRPGQTPHGYRRLGAATGSCIGQRGSRFEEHPTPPCTMH